MDKVLIVFDSNRESLSHVKEALWALSPDCFFAGVHDTVEMRGDLEIEVQGLLFTERSREAEAFCWILARLFENQANIQDLYKILHGVKNEVVAIRNHAMTGTSGQSVKLHCLAMIEQLQSNLRTRRQALQTFRDGEVRVQERSGTIAKYRLQTVDFALAGGL